jgi:hypothetical protein
MAFKKIFVWFIQIVLLLLRILNQLIFFFIFEIIIYFHNLDLIIFKCQESSAYTLTKEFWKVTRVSEFTVQNLKAQTPWSGSALPYQCQFCNFVLSRQFVFCFLALNSCIYISAFCYNLNIWTNFNKWTLSREESSFTNLYASVNWAENLFYPPIQKNKNRFLFHN